MFSPAGRIVIVTSSLLRKRNVFEVLFDALAGVDPVEIEGERIDELQRFVVLENLVLVEPGTRFGIFEQVLL